MAIFFHEFWTATSRHPPHAKHRSCLKGSCEERSNRTAWSEVGREFDPVKIRRCRWKREEGALFEMACFAKALSEREELGEAGKVHSKVSYSDVNSGC